MKRGQSARKRDRQNEKRRMRSRAIKSNLRTTIKKADAEPSDESLNTSYSVIDRAVKTRTLHKKTAARMKSKLARRPRGQA